jgi:hypothetical protein
MEDVIDTALTKLLALPVDARDTFVPATVGEQVAMKLIKSALDDGDMRALQMIADRTGGRAKQRERESGNAVDLAGQMQKLLGG